MAGRVLLLFLGMVVGPKAVPAFGPTRVVTVRDARTGRMLLPVSDQVLHIGIDLSIADEDIRGHVRYGAPGRSRLRMARADRSARQAAWLAGLGESGAGRLEA